MAKKYETLAHEQIERLVKSVTGDIVLENKRLDFEEFKIISKNYLQEISKEIENLQTRKNLIDRIAAIGSLMHGDVSGVQRILVLSHTYETALNNFLGRKIPITWVSTTGNIRIGQESTVLSLYGSANLGLSAQHGKGKSSFTGRIEGVNNQTFQKELLDPQLKKLQQQITRSAQNKKQVYREAKRRYNASPDMSYAKNPKTSSFVKNIYYRVLKTNGARLRWSGKISNPGYIGQGYVAMVLHSKNDVINDKIIFPSSKTAPPYNLIGQDYLRILSQYALQGDAIPGIIQGDVKATEDGHIQLAVKQGRNFSAASIAGNIAIAYALLYKAQTGLLNGDNIRQQLENVTSTRWQDIFEALSGVAKQQIDKVDIKILLDII